MFNDSASQMFILSKFRKVLQESTLFTGVADSLIGSFYCHVKLNSINEIPFNKQPANK